MKRSIFINIALISIVLTSCHQPATISDLPTQYVSMNDSVEIAYKQYGQGNNTLVFVHGFGCDVEAWESQFAYFKNKARLVFIDLPGHGQSSKPHTDYTLNFYADAVNSVLTALHIENAVLVGHSLGTAVSRQTAFSYPRLVSKLVDVDGVYCFFPPDSLLCAELQRQYTAFASLFENPDTKSVMEEFTTPLFIDSTPENVKAYAMNIMPQIPHHVANSTMINLVKPKYWTGEVIEKPSLIIASSKSQLPPDYKAIMSNLYSNMSYYELDNVGHFIMMEKPELFNQLLEKFIKL